LGASRAPGAGSNPSQRAQRRNHHASTYRGPPLPNPGEGVQMTALPWYLVADIGATNARLAVADLTSGRLQHVTTYQVAAYPDFALVLQEFLAVVAAAGRWRESPEAACLAVASVIDGDRAALTNSPWILHRPAIAGLLATEFVALINDFVAVGHGVADLVAADWRQLGGARPEAGKPVAVLGPGTGLGMCALVPADTGYVVVDSEGGHVDFAPVTAREMDVLAVLAAHFGRVSVERLLSGPGIVNIYRALAQLADVPAGDRGPADILTAVLAGSDGLAVETLNIFCGVLGSVAGNLALTLGAKGGVYIAGGIVPRMLDLLERSDFRHRFEAK